MDIESDTAKRNWTLTERGLDFADLIDFDWDTALIFDDNRHDYGERRQAALGFLNNRLIAIAFTVRSNKTRIISMRKANKRERKVYDNF